MSPAALASASSGADATSSDGMLAIPFLVVLVVAAVCMPLVLRARAQGRRGLAWWAPMLVLLAALGAFAVWVLTL